MSKTANLWVGLPVVLLVFAGTIWFTGSALGSAGFPWLWAVVLAAPTLVVGWLSYRKSPQGLWWLKAVAALVVTFISLLAILIGLMSSMKL